MLPDAKSIRPSPSLLLSGISTTVIDAEHLRVLLCPGEGSHQARLWLVSLLRSGKPCPALPCPALLQSQAVSRPTYNVPLTVCWLGNVILWENTVRV